jgi:hypothetical protein
MKSIRKAKDETQAQKDILRQAELHGYYGEAILDLLEQQANATKYKKLERLPL